MIEKSKARKRKLTVEETGRKGGQATLKKRGKKFYSEIAKKRWNKDKK